MGWALAMVGPDVTDEVFFKQASGLLHTVNHLVAVPGEDEVVASLIRLQPAGIANDVGPAACDDASIALMETKTNEFILAHAADFERITFDLMQEQDDQPPRMQNRHGRSAALRRKWSVVGKGPRKRATAEKSTQCTRRPEPVTDLVRETELLCITPRRLTAAGVDA